MKSMLRTLFALVTIVLPLTVVSDWHPNTNSLEEELYEFSLVAKEDSSKTNEDNHGTNYDNDYNNDMIYNVELINQWLLTSSYELSSYFESKTRERYLQQAQDVNFICTQYEKNSSGLLTCHCERSGHSDVQINCKYNNDLCNSDNTTCVTQNVTVIVNSTGATKGIQSCTAFTVLTNSTNPMDTCITLVPATPFLPNDGMFSKSNSVSCAVTFNGETCQSCGFCDDTASSSSSSTARSTQATNTAAPAATSIPPPSANFSFDCCNVQTDVKQTCGYVSSNGGAIPNFDQIPDSEKGQCKASSKAKSWTTTTLLFFGSMTSMLWLLVL